MFDLEKRQVALIKKARPDWQRGKLNGIGGHVEQGETPECCIKREFEEETGYKHEVKWTAYAKMSGPDYEVFCFSSNGMISELKSQTDEQIELVPIAEIGAQRRDLIENLLWLIPLAIDSLSDGRPLYSHIEYP